MVAKISFQGMAAVLLRSKPPELLLPFWDMLRSRKCCGKFKNKFRGLSRESRRLQNSKTSKRPADDETISPPAKRAKVECDCKQCFILKRKDLLSISQRNRHRAENGVHKVCLFADVHVFTELKLLILRKCAGNLGELWSTFLRLLYLLSTRLHLLTRKRRHMFIQSPAAFATQRRIWMQKWQGIHSNCGASSAAASAVAGSPPDYSGDDTTSSDSEGTDVDDDAGDLVDSDDDGGDLDEKADGRRLIDSMAAALFPGSRTTIADVVKLLLAYQSRHKTSNAALIDLYRILKVLLPGGNSLEDFQTLERLLSQGLPEIVCADACVNDHVLFINADRRWDAHGKRQHASASQCPVCKESRFDRLGRPRKVSVSCGMCMLMSLV